jgi:succinylglutamic semialdehyde dehydrogenase
MNNKMHQYLGGGWCAGEGAELQSICPATAQVVWQGLAASPTQVGQAVAAARAVSPRWAQLGFEARAALVCNFKTELQNRAEEVAQAISQEVGKPLWEARTEVTSMVNKVDISIQAHLERCPTRQTGEPASRAWLTHRPHGVLAVLGPYNFPGHLPQGHIIPALLAGNTVVFKPSEYAPGVAVLIQACWVAAGLPAGVLNLVLGDIQVGKALVAEPDLDGVLFTGSHAGGVALSRQFASQPQKILALEMGGNNPLVVWDVADQQAAIQTIVMSAYISAGQRCTCARRLIVPNDERGTALIGALQQALSGIELGAWSQSPQPFMGPVVSNIVAQRLLKAQADLIAAGAQALVPMRLLKAGTGLLSPGLLDSTHLNQAFDDELFGPLLQIQRVPDFESAIKAANQTRYGLAASLLSDDAGLWQQFWAQARAGIVNWNKPTTGAASSAPFGGIGDSGNHRPSAYYAADYCAYPVAGMGSDRLNKISPLPAGLIRLFAEPTARL